MALEAPLAGRYRVSFVGEHSIASAGRLEETSPAIGREATLLAALHTRVGDVTEAVRAEDRASTTLRHGDRIELRFQAPETTPGTVRDLFLISNGVYTSAPSGRDAGPAPAFALIQNHPNPFADETEIGFSLPRALDLRLEVFDLAGRRIAVLARGPYSAGTHSMVWDRRDAGRSRVRPGIYLCRLTAGGAEARMRMVVLP